MSALLPPLTSSIRASLPQVQYLDAFAVTVPAAVSATTAARALFQQAPAWVMALMRVRNVIGKALGLKSTAARPRLSSGPLHPGDWLGPFKTFAVSPREALLGLNDKHLDFRVSVFVEPSGAGSATVWVSTAVQFHNVVGRVYFAVVRPFHGLVVRALLRGGRTRLLAATASAA